MSKEAMKQSLITEAAIQSKDHPSKDARTFAKSVHEYLMAEQPAQQALDKMAENARELRLDYEPVPEKFMDALKFDVAQRTWVGLSDLDMDELENEYMKSAQTAHEFLRAIEAALRSKNS